MISEGIAYAAGGLALSLALAAGLQTVRLHSAQADLATLRQQVAEERVMRLEAAASAVEANRAVEQAYNQRLKEAIDDRDTANAQAADAAASAADAVQRLRQRAASTAARSCPAAQGPSAPAPSPAASSPSDLLADVLGRVVEDGRRVAEYADQLRIAGQVCVAAWPAP